MFALPHIVPKPCASVLVNLYLFVLTFLFPRWFMAYSAVGFDDVNRSLYNVALRILGLFWVIYFWIIFNLFSAQVCHAHK